MIQTKLFEIRDIPNRNGYRVSSDGRVFSCMTTGRKPKKSKTWKELKPHRREGYLDISLGRTFKSPVHRLVALAFIGECPIGQEVRHLNGIRDDNRLSNLTYGTRQDNCLDTVRHGRCNFANNPPLMGSAHPVAILNEEKVRLIKLDGRKLKFIARTYSVSISTISLIKMGKTWRHVT